METSEPLAPDSKPCPCCGIAAPGFRLSRRSALAGGAAMTAAALLTPSAANATSERPHFYCAMNVGNLGSKLDSAEPLQTYRDGLIKFFLGKRLTWLAEFFQADVPIQIAQGTLDALYDVDHARIVFGDRFVSIIGNRSHGAEQMAGMIAHENGHHLQVEYDLDSKMRNLDGFAIKYVELHADYMAGAYEAWCEKYSSTVASDLSATFYLIGDDNNRWNAQYHGTHAERFFYFQKGYFGFKQLQAERAGADGRLAAAQGFLFVRDDICSQQKNKCI